MKSFLKKLDRILKSNKRIPSLYERAEARFRGERGKLIGEKEVDGKNIKFFENYIVYRYLNDEENLEFPLFLADIRAIREVKEYSKFEEEFIEPKLVFKGPDLTELDIKGSKEEREGILELYNETSRNFWNRFVSELMKINKEN